jgi:superfamily I DNA/RNA helicase
MPDDIQNEWKEAVDLIVTSNHPKKVVVAGPGAGKTTLFKKLLQKSTTAKPDASHLVLTFINGLAAELEADLGGFAAVFTFHGYCFKLLHKNPHLREGLTDSFQVFPQLASIIKSDWAIQNQGGDAPQFVKEMRLAKENEATEYFIGRSNYYNAVGFDDMIFRVYQKLEVAPHFSEKYNLLLVDEYQDFNLLEVSLIDILSGKSPIVIAGDDDQSLYGSFRESSWNFIRGLYSSPEYESLGLPFCLRCPEVVVNAFDDVVKIATARNFLAGRIDKEYRYFPPVKMTDSLHHPKIKVLQTSVQRGGVNYFGKIIHNSIQKIPKEYITESRSKGFPTVLIIGNKQYLSQVSSFLKNLGYILDEKDDSRDSSGQIGRNDGLYILKKDPRARLGWRIMLEMDRPKFFTENLSEFLKFPNISDNLPAAYKEQVLAEATALAEPTPTNPVIPESEKPTIKLTSFQGAKGLSAQYVFVVGLHNGDLPKDPNRITDMDICKFLVALTRTRKQCYLIYTSLFAGVKKQPSEFLKWIGPSRKRYWYVNKEFLKANGIS